MKIERRKFNLKNLSERDRFLTQETIEKYDFDYDVEITLDNGDKVITSAKMANKLRKQKKC